MFFILLDFDVIQINCHWDLSFPIVRARHIDFNFFTNRLTSDVQKQVLNIKRGKFFYFNSLRFDTIFNNVLDCCRNLLGVFTLRAITRTFSSLTRNGLYSIVFPVDGNSSSYTGVAIFGKGMMSYRIFQYYYLLGDLSRSQ